MECYATAGVAAGHVHVLQAVRRVLSCSRVRESARQKREYEHTKSCWCRGSCTPDVGIGISQGLSLLQAASASMTSWPWHPAAHSCLLGADPNAPNPDFKSPLHLAAARGKPDLLRLLLDRWGWGAGRVKGRGQAGQVGDKGMGMEVLKEVLKQVLKPGRRLGRWTFVRICCAGC